MEFGVKSFSSLLFGGFLPYTPPPPRVVPWHKSQRGSIAFCQEQELSPQDHFVFDKKSSSSQMKTYFFQGSLHLNSPLERHQTLTSINRTKAKSTFLKPGVSNKYYANGLHRPKFLLLPRALGLANHMINSRETLRKNRDSFSFHDQEN